MALVPHECQPLLRFYLNLVTGREVGPRFGLQVGGVLGADRALVGVTTTRMKRATARRINRTRYVTLENNPCPVLTPDGSRPRHRREEGLCIRMLRRCI